MTNNDDDDDDYNKDYYINVTKNYPSSNLGKGYLDYCYLEAQ